MARANPNLALETGRNKSGFMLFTHVKWQHLAAGVSGGVISTLVLHPLDLIKVRFQGKHFSSVIITKY